MRYLLVSLVMGMAADTIGTTLQNQTVDPFPLYEDLGERQISEPEDTNMIGYVHPGDLRNRQLSSNNSDTKVLFRSKRAFGISAAVALAGVAVSTASLLTSTLHTKYNRNFEMRVENFLELPIKRAKALTWWGRISSSPDSITPCEVGALAGHKVPHTATGTSGIVSWKIKEKDLTIIVFWSVPFNRNGEYGCNSLGLAIYKGLPPTEPRYNNRYLYFYDMYKKGNRYQAHVHHVEKESKTIRSFINNCYESGPFCINKAGIWLCGSMSTFKHAKIEIKVAEVEDPLYCHGDNSTYFRQSSDKHTGG